MQISWPFFSLARRLRWCREEAARAGELVGLLRDDAHRQFLAGQVRAGQFEGLGRFGFVDVDGRRLGFVAPSLEFFEESSETSSVSVRRGAS